MLTVTRPREAIYGGPPHSISSPGTRRGDARGPGAGSLDAHVRKHIEDLGLWAYHPRNSKGSEPGWPNWVIIGRAGILYRELKSEAGTVTPEQRHVGELIARAGGNWAVWRPRDLLDGTIGRELEAWPRFSSACLTVCHDRPPGQAGGQNTWTASPPSTG